MRRYYPVFFSYLIIALVCGHCSDDASSAEDSGAEQMDSGKASDSSSASADTTNQATDSLNRDTDRADHSDHQDTAAPDQGPKPTGTYKTVGLVLANDTYDATAKFEIVDAVAIFHPEEEFSFQPAPLGACRVVAATKGGGTWISSARTPGFSQTSSVGSEISLTKGAATIQLIYQAGQYYPVNFPQQMELGPWQLSFAGSGSIPSYAGPGPDFPDYPGYSPSEPWDPALNVPRSKALSLSYKGSPADMIVVDLFSHSPSWNPVSGSGQATEVVCAYKDSGQVTIPQADVAKVIAGKGQVTVSRLRFQVRSLSNGQQILCVGMTGFYYNSSFF